MDLDMIPVGDLELRGVHMTIDPPGDDEEPEDIPRLSIHTSLWEPDGTSKSAAVNVVADGATVDQIAEALIQAMVGVAAMHSPGVLAAVKYRLVDR
jgi:hypothetical protein